MFYREVFRKLNETNVKYLVVGGVAVNFHGYPRSTYDLDLMIDLGENNIRLCWSALTSLEFHPMIPVTLDEFVSRERRQALREQKNMLVLSFIRQAKAQQVIDILNENPLNFEDCQRRRKLFHAYEIAIPIMAIEDLIALKKLAPRQQDQDDITALERLMRLQHGTQQ